MRPRSAEPIGASGHATTASIGRTHDRKQPDHPGRPLFSCEPGAIHTCDFSSTESTTACAGGSTYSPTMSRSLAAKAGSLEQLEGLQAVGLQTVGAPDPLHRAARDADRLGHGAAGPVGRLAGRRRAGQAHHLVDDRGRQRRNAAAGRVLSRNSPATPLGHEPLLPAPDAGLRHAGAAHDLGRAAAIAGRQNDPSPPDMFSAGCCDPPRPAPAGHGPRHSPRC